MMQSIEAFGAVAATWLHTFGWLVGDVTRRGGRRRYTRKMEWRRLYVHVDRHSGISLGGGQISVLPFLSLLHKKKSHHHQPKQVVVHRMARRRARQKKRAAKSQPSSSKNQFLLHHFLIKPSKAFLSFDRSMSGTDKHSAAPPPRPHQKKLI